MKPLHNLNVCLSHHDMQTDTSVSLLKIRTIKSYRKIPTRTTKSS